MSSDLWLGVAFSIPVGLAINIVSPRVLRWIDKRNQDSADKRSERDAQFKAKAEQFAKDRPALYVYLLETLVRAAYIGALFGVLSGTMFLLTQSTSALAHLYAIRFFMAAVGGVGQLFALLGAITVLNITRNAVLMVREVRNVDKPS
ncbi:hypothetical protein [Mycobacterium asiaticum]|uniref:hypothetical protein n=1 Tax=Mycobacterium asiaticum TaxID=1790 RepID=UPI00056A167B|nr:hypothetical protein [Mycobacterium asiaticum]ORA11357.1 hypothetical protein BST16_19860 [Mycobacterium asiaticum DSM 44297]